jgi:hypothetical protein
MEGADPAEESAETQDTQDHRLDALEAGQAEQGGKLDQIIGMLKGGETEAHAAAQAHTERRLDESSTIADQVKQAVRDVHAEEDQAKAKPVPEPEQAPRESQSGIKGKLQRAMFGGDPA